MKVVQTCIFTFEGPRSQILSVQTVRAYKMTLELFSCHWGHRSPFWLFRDSKHFYTLMTLWGQTPWNLQWANCNASLIHSYQRGYEHLYRKNYEGKCRHFVWTFVVIARGRVLLSPPLDFPATSLETEHLYGQLKSHWKNQAPLGNYKSGGGGELAS